MAQRRDRPDADVLNNHKAAEEALGNPGNLRDNGSVIAARTGVIGSKKLGSSD